MPVHLAARLPSRRFTLRAARPLRGLHFDTRHKRRLRAAHVTARDTFARENFQPIAIGECQLIRGHLVKATRKLQSAADCVTRVY